MVHAQLALEELLEYDFATAVAALDHWVGDEPERLAIHNGENDERLTYAEFGRRTDYIAGNLAARGLRAGDSVSVLSTQPLVAALAMYGIWKAGGLYAPVNFQYTGDLLAYQLNDTRPSLLLVDEALAETVVAVEHLLQQLPERIVIGPQGGGPFEELLRPADRPAFRPASHDPANIIYTSGTTGPSKGVIQSHRWVNGYTWAGRRSLTRDDVVYNDLPMYHVGGAHFNVTRALWSGAAVSLWARFSPTDFWSRIRAGNCTTAVLLDVMTPWLLNAEPRDDDRLNPLNKVHMQPLPVDHHEFAVRFGIDFVTSGFGQSETGASLMLLIDELDERQGTPPELYRGLDRAAIRASFSDSGLAVRPGDSVLPKGIMGHPAPFMEVAVLDELDHEVAAGEIGQLAMRPKLPSLIFTEYLAKPEATVSAWRNLWFHTGDAALREHDGTFCYVDRIGDRIRVRGENISSFHVEELVAKHSTVQLAAVIAVPSDEGDEDDVVAFIEVAVDATFDDAALSQHCAETMPKYMRPKAFVQVEEIPRTPTNKIEKYKLRRQWMDGVHR